MNSDNADLICVHPRLKSYPVFFRVGVSAVSRDDVEDPAEQAASPTPKEKSHEQPQDSSQNAAVINLAETRNNQTQYPRYKRIAHRSSYLHSGSSYDDNSRFVRPYLSAISCCHAARQQSRRGTSSASVVRPDCSPPSRAGAAFRAVLRPRDRAVHRQPSNL